MKHTPAERKLIRAAKAAGFAAGQETFKNGKARIMPNYLGQPESTRIVYAKEFYRGWDSANLSA